jgi:hypothetical protein
MSWTRTYRLALHLLPAELRRKHGPAMEVLFARELRRAREHGRLEGILAGAAGVWDVIRRGAYEQVRPGRDAADEHHDHTSWEWWNTDAHETQPAGANLGEPHVPRYTTRQLLRRHAVSFAIAFVALTASMLALFARKQVPALSARGAPAGTIAEALLLAAALVLTVRRRVRLTPGGRGRWPPETRRHWVTPS